MGPDGAGEHLFGTSRILRACLRQRLVPLCLDDQSKMSDRGCIRPSSRSTWKEVTGYLLG